MSAALNDSAAGYPLAVGELQRGLAVHAAGQVDLATFLRHVHGVAALLPPGQHAINLCEDRYRFLVGFCAVALRGQVTLLPSSRAPAVVADVRKRYPATWCLSDSALDDAVDCLILPTQLPEVDGAMPMLPAEQLVAIGFTSGSTGTPTANAKTWGAFVASTGQNLAALSDLWGQALPSVVATVPPQHMYGMELSVLFPLLAPACVHAGKPFFPEDVAAALAQAPVPRLLVTTPVHLRALLRSGVQLPALAGIVTATAPLPQELAVAAEAQFATEVREMFGSTETCIFARRRTARDVAWTLLPGVQLQPHADGTAVQAPHLAAPVVLADVMELAADGRRFTLLGRRADLLEIAGKRASLGDLTKRLLAVEGVEDAALLQLPPEPGQVISRLAALVVAPTLDEAQILQALRTEMDPVFLPRPLRKVAVLPRNETGKLPRDALLALLRG